MEKLESIKSFLKDEGYRDNIALATLLDALTSDDQDELVEEIESQMEDLDVSSSTRVATFIGMLEAQAEDGNETEETEDEEALENQED